MSCIHCTLASSASRDAGADQPLMQQRFRLLEANAVNHAVDFGIQGVPNRLSKVRMLRENQ